MEQGRSLTWAEWRDVPFLQDPRSSLDSTAAAGYESLTGGTTQMRRGSAYRRSAGATGGPTRKPSVVSAAMALA